MKVNIDLDRTEWKEELPTLAFSDYAYNHKRLQIAPSASRRSTYLARYVFGRTDSNFGKRLDQLPPLRRHYVREDLSIGEPYQRPLKSASQGGCDRLSRTMTFGFRNHLLLRFESTSSPTTAATTDGAASPGVAT